MSQAPNVSRLWQTHILIVDSIKLLLYDVVSETTLVFSLITISIIAESVTLYETIPLHATFVLRIAVNIN